MDHAFQNQLGSVIQVDESEPLRIQEANGKFVFIAELLLESVSEEGQHESIMRLVSGGENVLEHSLTMLILLANKDEDGQS